MKKILLFGLIYCLAFTTTAQDLFHKIDIKKQLKEDIDYNYLDDDWLKQGINKELAIAKATKAIERINIGNFEEAYEDIKEVINLDPESDYPYILKGLCCLELDSIQLSKKAFQKANQIDNLNSIPFFYLGYISAIEKDYKSAKRNYQSIIKIDKKSFLGYYGLGNMYFLQGQFVNAKKYYVKAVAVNPDFYEGFYNIGIIELLDGHPENALKYFKNTIVSNSEFSNAYHILGLIYYYNDEDEKAKEHWDKAIEYDSEDNLYLLTRAIYYLNHENIDLAYNDIIKALRVNMGKNNLLSDFGTFDDEKNRNSVSQFLIFDDNRQFIKDTVEYTLISYLTNSLFGYYKRAKGHIDYAYSIDSTSAIINYFRGNEYENYLYYDEAIEYYEKSLSKEPFIIESYLKLGILNFRIEEYEKSIDNITNFLNNVDTAKIAYRCRGTSYMKIGNFEKALYDFERFIQKDTLDFEILFNKAVCHKKLNDLNTAKSTFNKALELKEGDDETLYLLAECKFYSGDSLGALSDLDSISITYCDSNLDFHRLRGMVNIQLEKYNDAVVDFSSGLEIDPDDTELLDNRGMLYRALGNYKSALNDYSRLIKLRPEIADTYFIRGSVYVKLKEFNNACLDFKTAESKGYLLPRGALSICNIGQ